MLGNKEWNHVRVISQGSVYTVRQGKHTMGYAFYYCVGGGRKVRKTVTGRDRDELREKAVRFLDGKEEEYERAMAVAGTMEKTVAGTMEMAAAGTMEMAAAGTMEMAAAGTAEKAVAGTAEKAGAVVPKTFREAGDEWFAAYRAGERYEDGGKSFASVESRMCSLKRIYEKIGDMPVAGVSDAVAGKLMAECSRKEGGGYYSFSHMDKLQQTFQKVMAYAHKKGYCESVPDRVALNSRLTRVDTDSRFLDEHQIKELCGALEGNMRYRTVVLLLVATGLRQEEAFALNTSDFSVRGDGNVEVDICKTVVETEGHVFKIVDRTKTLGSRRKVYIPPEVYGEVMKYYGHTVRNETAEQRAKRKENGTEGCIFLNKDMKPLNKRTFQRNFRDYLRGHCRKDMDYDVTLHMLRHSFASLQAETMGLDKVAKLMGDSITTVSRTYQSITDRTKGAVCENSARIYNSITNNPEE